MDKDCMAMEGGLPLAPAEEAELALLRGDAAPERQVAWNED
ncbi:hypothetical protein [Anaeromyxobacter paludicola]|uniref:Uncharacterized protein n=1 Tax=Anaeromyxobacter paludicola TaxID=2918171 RepID=A0ABN6N5A3_9BACT|nr:hypothetical protein [Anaeromyxobacter paludicola]BDG08211.1 hypothetical protein AMPC_13240 [Anaeromyxobacter paludicola]